MQRLPLSVADVSVPPGLTQIPRATSRSLTVVGVRVRLFAKCVVSAGPNSRPPQADVDREQ